MYKEMSNSEKQNISSEKLSSEKKIPYVEWTPDHENILVEWADKAMCYRWLHGKSHQHFSKAKHMVYYSSHYNEYSYRNS